MFDHYDDREANRLSRIYDNEPSESAKAIVAERKKNSAIDSVRAEMELAAHDMGIPVKKLAAGILVERELANSVRTNTNRAEFEVGYSATESRERLEWNRIQAIAAHNHGGYYFARELLTQIGRDKGVVVESLATGDVIVKAVKRAIDPAYAERLLDKAARNLENAKSRVDAAELAIANSPLSHVESNIPPAMKRELAKSLDALLVAEKRMHKAYARMADATTISADGIRLEMVIEFDAETVSHYDISGVMPGNSAIASWELPNQIIRRPFREFKRLRHYRKWPESPEENAIIRKENAVEIAAVRRQARELINAMLEQKHAEELAIQEAEVAARNAEYKKRESSRNHHSQNEQNAEFKMRESLRKRNARARNRGK